MAALAAVPRSRHAGLARCAGIRRVSENRAAGFSNLAQSLADAVERRTTWAARHRAARCRTGLPLSISMRRNSKPRAAPPPRCGPCPATGRRAPAASAPRRAPCPSMHQWPAIQSELLGQLAGPAPRPAPAPQKFADGRPSRGPAAIPSLSGLICSWGRLCTFRAGGLEQMRNLVANAAHGISRARRASGSAPAPGQRLAPGGCLARRCDPDYLPGRPLRAHRAPRPVRPVRGMRSAAGTTRPPRCSPRNT